MKRTIAFTRMIVLMVSVLFAATHAERFNAQQGQMWLGGNINYLTMGIKYKESLYSSDERINLLMFSPILRFFPANYFSFGPKLSWTGMFQDGYSVNLWGLGIEPGFVYGGDNVLPYFFVAPHASIMSFNSDSDYDDSDSEVMFKLPFSAGLVLPIAESVGFQFEVGFSLGFHEDVTTNTFFIGIGICGLGENVAVSVINSISALSSTYF